MISVEQFVECSKSEVLKRDITSNKEQYEAIISPASLSHKIIAGPGSGKTTVLVFRILKIIFVDDVNPSEIIATTFTIKAADELKSRILSWGETIRQYCLSHFTLTEKERSSILEINFDLITSGTLDSIAEKTLSEHRLPGQAPPSIVDNAVSYSLMNKKGFMGTRSYSQPAKSRIEEEELKIFGKISPNSKRAMNFVELNSRLRENLIDIESATGFPYIKKCLIAYRNYLEDNLLLDFSSLEQKYYDFLNDERSEDYLNSIKFVLVDEYQDTNLLQESIYKKLFSVVFSNCGSCMVVGDDDQSLYRFRGSRVYLFKDLEKRMENLRIKFNLVFLSKNYRSTPNIVKFYNEFIKLDSGFQPARISKPDMTAERKDCINYPVLGMFRDSIEQLTKDLGDFIYDIVKGDGFTFEDGDGIKWVIKSDDNGSAADISVLFSSPAEYTKSEYGRGNERLPLLLNNYLSSKGINVFNPRGKDLQDISNVGLICGLTLLCIDPNNEYIVTSYDEKDDKSVWVSSEVFNVINGWRLIAQNYINESHIVRETSLKSYVESWQQMRVLNSTKWDKSDVPIIDIMYNLLAWVPSMQKELENLVYLEAVCRTADNSSLVNNFNSKISFDYDLIPNPDGGFDKCYRISYKSVKSAITDIFVPLASGLIEIDESLMSDAPYDKIDLMSIHQSKGLEFPITIVDVASNFSSEQHTQRKQRFPDVKHLDDASFVEEFLSELNPDIKLNRCKLDSCFDDLTRKYFVAFSRPQDVLLLVGLSPNAYDYGGKIIPNIGTGWARNSNWVWGKGLHNLLLL